MGSRFLLVSSLTSRTVTRLRSENRHNGISHQRRHPHAAGICRSPETCKLPSPCHNESACHQLGSFQFISTGICLLPSITSGAILVYPVISVPYYKNETETPLNHPLTVEEQSWFGKHLKLYNQPAFSYRHCSYITVSILLICSMVGNLLSGYSVEKIGRRWTLIVSNVAILVT